MQAFADYVSLVYHEARNVRHLASSGLIDRQPYERLISEIDKNRKKAWSEIQPLRRQAADASSPAEAEEVFRDRFGLNLEELAELFAHEGWRGTSYGGNQWAPITRAVIELVGPITRGDSEMADRLASDISAMCHNNGRVGDKLEDLDSSLEG